MKSYINKRCASEKKNVTLESQRVAYLHKLHASYMLSLELGLIKIEHKQLMKF